MNSGKLFIVSICFFPFISLATIDKSYTILPGGKMGSNSSLKIDLTTLNDNIDYSVCCPVTVGSETDGDRVNISTATQNYNYGFGCDPGGSDCSSTKPQELYTWFDQAEGMALQQIKNTQLIAACVGVNKSKDGDSISFENLDDTISVNVEGCLALPAVEERSS
jgi:hypothetical protein